MEKNNSLCLQYRLKLLLTKKTQLYFLHSLKTKDFLKYRKYQKLLVILAAVCILLVNHNHYYNH